MKTNNKPKLDRNGRAREGERAIWILSFFLRGLLIIVILNEVKNLYPRFTDVRDVSAALNMTFLEQPLSIFEEDIF